MKNTLLIFATIFALGCHKGGSIIQSSSSSPASNRFFAMGINCSAMEWGSAVPGTANTDYPLPTSSELDYYKSKGLKLVRLPVKWERLQPTINGALNTTYLGYITSFIDSANSRGMTVIVDIHNFAQRTEGKIGSTAVPVSAFADLWSKLSAVLVTKAGIQGYDLMNEPALISSTVWVSAAQAAITAIRAIDTTNYIYVEGSGYASAWNWDTMNPTLHTLKDPINKLVFSAHVYLDRDNSGSHFTWADEVAAGSSAPSGVPIDTNIGVVRLKPFFTWLNKYGFRGHVGEIGTGNDNTAWNEALDNALAYAKANEVQVTYWAGGPWWGTYGYSVESGITSGVLQAKQMAILTKYTGVTTQPLIYTISGPTRGTAGVASSDFTVDYRGQVSSDITLTLSDNGGGGSFTPSSVILHGGYNATATFKYTGPSNKTVAITATNDGGLTDPTVGYSTSSDLFMSITSTAKNIYALRRIYAPYVGPLVRLQRDSDNAQKDFGATTSGDLDRAAIQAWSGGPNSMLRLIKWYDQSPSANHILPVFSTNNVGATSPRDYPIFYLNASDGYPVIRFSNSRMDFRSPLTAITAQTIISYINHKSGTRLFTGEFNAHDTWIGDTASGWGISTEPSSSLTIGIIANEWHRYEGTWKANTTNGWNTYRDGGLIGTHDAQAASFTLDTQGDIFNMGWFRWWNTTRWAGDIREAIIFQGALSASEISDVDADINTYYTHPLAALPSYSDPVITPVSGPALPTKYKGTNLSGAENGNAYAVLNYDYTYPTTTEIDYYHSKGLTTIRLPFDANKLQPVRNDTLNTGELAHIDKIVQYCRSLGMYVILDPHNYGTLRNSAGTARVIGVDADMPASTLADFWSRLATVYKNQPNVIFGLMNEPHTQNATQWKTVATGAVTAIRATGATQLILIPGTAYTGAWSWVSSGNAAAWAGFTDSNFAFELHQYLDSDSSGTHSTCTTGSGASRLSAFETWARTNSVKGFLGEVGWSTDSSCTPEGTAIMAHMTSNSDVWLGWTYWAGGPWMATYMFNLDPTGLGTATVTDRPQMSILLNNL